ncbi:MAG: glycosyltransferase [Candidatus Bathyarchaeota archaeon]|nr:glycosyltransferase [Candidatus Bathyarchaeota archaeon]
MAQSTVSASLYPDSLKTTVRRPSIQFIEWRGASLALGSELKKHGFTCSVIPLKSIRNSLSLPTLGYIHKIDSDILVTHNPYHGLMGAKIAKSMKKVKAIGLRLKGNYWEESEEKGVPFRQKLGFTLKKLQNENSLNDVDFVVTVSNYLNRIAVSKGIPNVYTMYCGVDTDRFKAYPSDPRYKSEILCAMNFNVLGKIKLLERFFEYYRDSRLPYTVTFLGDGAYRSRAAGWVKQHGLQEQVEFKGYVGDIERYYANCELLIHPSGLDTLGMVIQEASASEKPVVATRVGGIPEIIEEGKTGYTTNDFGLFMERIAQLMGDPELRRSMGRRGRDYMQEKFTWKKSAEQFIQILRNEHLLD